MAYGTRIAFDSVREAAFGTITGSYLPIGAPLTRHARIAYFGNSTDGFVYVSLDGVHNHILLAPNSFQLFDFAANLIRDDGLFISQETQFYIKSAGSLTEGEVYIEIVTGIGAPA